MLIIWQRKVNGVLRGQYGRKSEQQGRYESVSYHWTCGEGVRLWPRIAPNVYYNLNLTLTVNNIEYNFNANPTSEFLQK